MAKVKGLDIYLKVNTGTEASPVWTKVGGQTGATFDRGAAVIDITDKDSGGDEEHLPGVRNWSVSFDAFLIEDNAGFLEVETAFDAGEQKQFQIITPGYAYMGKASVESLSVAADKDAAGVASFSLKGTGALTKTAV
jgi:TP901-1 family phage major tail protein